MRADPDRQVQLEAALRFLVEIGRLGTFSSWTTRKGLRWRLVAVDGSKFLGHTGGTEEFARELYAGSACWPMDPTNIDA